MRTDFQRYKFLHSHSASTERPISNYLFLASLHDPRAILSPVICWWGNTLFETMPDKANEFTFIEIADAINPKSSLGVSQLLPAEDMRLE